MHEHKDNESHITIIWHYLQLFKDVLNTAIS